MCGMAGMPCLWYIVLSSVVCIVSRMLYSTWSPVGRGALQVQQRVLEPALVLELLELLELLEPEPEPELQLVQQPEACACVTSMPQASTCAMNKHAPS